MSKRSGCIARMNSHNAVYQSVLAVLLMSAIPLLATIYLFMSSGPEAEPLSPALRGSIIATILILAVAGFCVFLKFPQNIIRLRRYIEAVASGVIPEQVTLLHTCNSDDLLFIEKGLSTVLKQMEERIELAEHMLQIEHDLRKTVEQQQRTLIHAERHRAMVQSLGAACHHLGQPATILTMRLHILKQLDISEEEREQINECEKSLKSIMDILEKLRMVTDFRTEPYLTSGDGENVEILAI